MKGSYGAEFGITKCRVEICPGYNAVLENAALENAAFIYAASDRVARNSAALNCVK